MSTVFRKRRPGGVSHQEVIVELVSGHEPGRVFTYEELAAALAAGADREFDRQDVQQVVRLAKFRLLREHKRTFACVPNVGYQLAHAKEHRGIAESHTRRGHRQMKRALVTMENARLDEMTAGERDLHLAQCEINHRLYHEQRRMLAKQSRHDELIARLVSRVDQLEASKGA
jgi:hypothetical protein